MLLDRSDQSNKFWKKSLRHPSLSTLKVLQGKSRINLPRAFLERQIRMSPKRQIGTSHRPFPDGQIGSLRRRPGNFEGERPRDVLGTNICRLGFHLKESNTGKVQFLFFWRILLVMTNFLFREDDWVLDDWGNNSMKLWDFPLFPNFLRF